MDNNPQEKESSKQATQTPNTTLPPSNTSRPASKKTAKAPASLWPLTALVIVLFSFSAAASVYLWQMLEQQKAVVAKNTLTGNQTSQQSAQITNAMAKRIKQLESALTTQTQHLTNLDKLALFNTNELSRLHASDRVDWLLAEAEYLLRLANQRLNIERDAKGAEAILVASDKVLAEIDDPSIYPIRESLRQEILALQSLAKVDLDGFYLQLQAMIKTLDTLGQESFLVKKTSQTPAPSKAEEANYAQQLWNTIWQDLKQALVIRRLDEPAAPLLAPEQSYFLKQNLQLILEQAALAVLKEDNATFQHNLERAQQWLAQYYVKSNQTIEALTSSVASLRQHNISQTLPDISESLRLLKSRVEAMYRSHELDRNTSLNDKSSLQSTDETPNSQAPQAAPNAVQDAAPGKTEPAKQTMAKEPQA